jgi:hypothetical protein
MNYFLDIFEQPGKALYTLYLTQDMSEKIVTILIILVFSIFNFIFGVHHDECLIKELNSSGINLQIYLIVNAIRGIYGAIFVFFLPTGFHPDYSYTYQNQVISILAYLGICWEYLHSIYFFILMHQTIHCSSNIEVYLYVYCSYQLLHGFIVLLLPYIKMI